MRNQGERHDAADVQVCNEGRYGGATGGTDGAGECRFNRGCRVMEGWGKAEGGSYSKLFYHDGSRKPGSPFKQMLLVQSIVCGVLVLLRAAWRGQRAGT